MTALVLLLLLALRLDRALLVLALLAPLAACSGCVLYPSESSDAGDLGPADLGEPPDDLSCPVRPPGCTCGPELSCVLGIAGWACYPCPPGPRDMQADPTIPPSEWRVNKVPQAPFALDDARRRP